MRIEISKEMIIDMIVGGCSIPMGGISEELTPFSGNQWNENWHWNREELRFYNLETLLALYVKYK